MKSSLVMAWRFAAFALVVTGSAQSPPPSPLVERVADTGFIQLEADSFRQLERRQKALAYWLTHASIAIDPDHLRSVVGVRPSREARCSRRSSCRPAGVPPAALREDPDVRAAVLGEPRQPQRDHRAEIPADVHGRRARAGRAPRARQRRLQDAVRGSSARSRPRRTCKTSWPTCSGRSSTPRSSR